MAVEMRERMIAAFTTDPRVTVFLMSLKAGGVALNLTAARWGQGKGARGQRGGGCGAGCEGWKGT